MDKTSRMQIVNALNAARGDMPYEEKFLVELHREYILEGIDACIAELEKMLVSNPAEYGKALCISELKTLRERKAKE